MANSHLANKISLGAKQPFLCFTPKKYGKLCLTKNACFTACFLFFVCSEVFIPVTINPNITLTCQLPS